MVAFYHFCEGIEVKGLCLLELLLYGFDSFTQCALSAVCCPSGRYGNSLDKHTHHSQHGGTGTSVVDGGYHDVLFASSLMQQVEEHGQEIVALSESVLSAECVNSRCIYVDVFYAKGFIGCSIDSVRPYCHLCSLQHVVEVFFCFPVLFGIDQFLLVQCKVEGCVGLCLQFLSCVSTLKVGHEDLNGESVIDDVVDVYQCIDLIAGCVELNAIQVVAQEVEGAYALLQQVEHVLFRCLFLLFLYEYVDGSLVASYLNDVVATLFKMGLDVGVSVHDGSQCLL